MDFTKAQQAIVSTVFAVTTVFASAATFAGKPKVDADGAKLQHVLNTSCAKALSNFNHATGADDPANPFFDLDSDKAREAAALLVQCELDNGAKPPQTLLNIKPQRPANGAAATASAPAP